MSGRLVRNKLMNELIIIQKIWNFYLSRIHTNVPSHKKNFLLKEIKKTTLSLNKTNLNGKLDPSKRNALILYSSDRGFN